MNAHTISLILVSILISCLHSNSSYSDVHVEVQIKSIKEAMYKPGNDGEEKRRQDVFVEDITSEIFYDKEGNVMESIYYNTPTDIRSINKIKRNKKGKIIEMNQYDAQNKLTNKSKFSHDKKGNLSNQKSYKEGKKLNNTFTFQYDENGNAIQEINENKASGNKWITNMTYNKMNQLVEEIKTFPTGTSDKRTFEYDEKGNEVKSILIKSNGKETTFISEYDDQNNLIVQKWYDKEGKQTHKTSFSYVYDQHNNWVTKRRFSNDELGLIWEREIAYYEN